MIALDPTAIWLLAFALAGVGLGLGALGGSWLLRRLRPRRPNAHRHRPLPGTSTAYESGEQAIGSVAGAVSVRYFAVALAFLLFELEVVFLFPWATLTRLPEVLVPHARVVATGCIFILILAVGLVFLWAQGYLDWGPEPRHARPWSSPVPRELYGRVYGEGLPTTSGTTTRSVSDQTRSGPGWVEGPGSGLRSGAVSGGDTGSISGSRSGV